MRRLCLVVLIGALLALPSWTQQRNLGSNDNAASRNAVSEDGAAESASQGGANVIPYHNVFALPALPGPTPFPSPAATADSNEPPGKLAPRYELAGGFSYINFNPGGSFSSFNNYGGTGSFVFNPNHWLGLVAEAGTYSFSRNVNGANVGGGGDQSFLFGPRLNLRRDYFVPFVEFLVGDFRANGALTGGSPQSSFGLAAGGGVDIVFTKNFAWRFAQIDYLMTNVSGASLGPSARQNSLRLGTGLVLRWGFPAPPPPPPPAGPPVAACSANPTSVFQGWTDTVAVHVNANSPANLPLTYSYTATAGNVEGTGPDARWSPSGAAVGSYTVNAKVDDSKGGTASCAVDIKVEERPHHPPTVSCSANPTTIMPGERSTVTCNGSSPDNLPLTYSYQASGGQVTGNGPEAQFDSTGVAPGSYKVTGTVTDPRSDKADSSATIDVQQPPPPPQPINVGNCDYRTTGSSRVDNVCKRVLDDVALRLKNDPNAKVAIVGFADPKEPKAAKLAATRAELAKQYLGEKGIDASRISTRTGEASNQPGSEKQNRHIEAIFVPEGATY